MIPAMSGLVERLRDHFWGADIADTLTRWERDKDEAASRIEALEGVLATADGWLSRWAQHVGSCVGGDACSCGLTRLRWEIEAARSLSQSEEESR